MRRSAVLACQILGSEAQPAIPALVELLDSDISLGYIGATLGAIGPAAVETLTGLLKKEKTDIRIEAVVALGNMSIGPRRVPVSSAIPSLISCLEDKTPIVRSLAARSLGQIAAEESTVVPALIQALLDTNVPTQWNACLALGKFGIRAKLAVPALSAALDNTHPDVRGTAAIALVQIEPDNVPLLGKLMPILIENIEGIGGTNINFRSTTAIALGALGSKAGQAVPALLKAVQEVSKQDRMGIVGSSNGHSRWEKMSIYERQQIVAALKKIDPEAGAKADLK